MQRHVNGAAVRAIRLALGIPQQDLAARSGISRSHMNKIESGAEQPKFETAVRIAAQLGVAVDAVTYPVPDVVTA